MAGSKSLGHLLVFPVLITWGVTLLRLARDLKHWPSPLFSAAVGEGLAIIGISWPLIFGPSFAARFGRSGDVPSGVWRPIGFALLGMATFVATGLAASAIPLLSTFPAGTIVFFVALVMAGVVQYPGWSSLFRMLVTDGYAARIPVAILMFFAYQGNWGTHHDSLPPNAPALSPRPEYFWFGLLPQLAIWMGSTIIAGILSGGIIAAPMRRGHGCILSPGVQEWPEELRLERAPQVIIKT
jgi:hypothetical protein